MYAYKILLNIYIFDKIKLKLTNYIFDGKRYITSNCCRKN